MDSASTVLNHAHIIDYFSALVQTLILSHHPTSSDERTILP